MSENFTKSRKKVVVAMSGGVDSSVAAALLKEEGYDLIGVTMALYCSTSSSDRGCCSVSAAADAKKVADQLGFPHYTLNFKDEFKRFVIDNFIEEYKSGRTPNPCVRCNQFMKFDLLLRKARELGADLIATGHYARIQPSPPLSPSPRGRGGGLGIVEAGGEGCWKLLKGKDPKKDQSYVLYRLTQDQLAHVMFPLGKMTKDKVRAKAKELGLAVADKAESQEICFVEDDDYAGFLKKEAPELVKPGEIVDKQSNVVGRHEGIAFYTIGQRKGIGAHKGEPKYVIGIDQPKNRVIIGDDKDTLKSELIANEITFVSSQWPTEPLEITAKIRYNSTEAGAVLNIEHGTRSTEHRARLIFERPQRAVTPGQSVVFYKGEELIGGGIID